MQHVFACVLRPFLRVRISNLKMFMRAPLEKAIATCSGPDSIAKLEIVKEQDRADVTFSTASAAAGALLGLDGKAYGPPGKQTTLRVVPVFPD